MEQNDQEWIDYRCLPPCNKLLCRYIETETPFAFEIKCSNRKCHTINNRGNCITLNLVEMRCPNIDPKQSAKRGEDVICNKLLARVLPGTIIQVKCPRCGAIVESTPDTLKKESK